MGCWHTDSRELERDQNTDKTGARDISETFENTDGSLCVAASENLANNIHHEMF